MAAFTGKYETESQENYEEFLKHMGIPDDIIEKGRGYSIVTEVVQNGSDFTWTQIYPSTSTTNSFTVDRECDMQTVLGKHFKATVTMEEGKLSVSFPNYRHTAEISGDKLIERSTVSGEQGTVTMTRMSKRI